MGGTFLIADLWRNAAVGAEFEAAVAPLDGATEEASGPDCEAEEIAEGNDPEIAEDFAIAQNAGSDPDSGDDADGEHGGGDTPVMSGEGDQRPESSVGDDVPVVAGGAGDA